MSGLRRWGLTVLTMASVATIVLFFTGWSSAVAAQLNNVFVTNTSQSPVPVRVTGTAPVHEQGTANVDVTNTTPLSVQETNTDTNGNIKVHEQGTANVNVTNGDLSVTSGDRTQIIADGTVTIHPGDTDLIPKTSPIDTAAYKTLTFYWTVGDTTGQTYEAATEDGSNVFDLCFDCQPVGQKNGSGSETFDPAPPNLFVTWENSDVTDRSLEWMLVGRAN